YRGMGSVGAMARGSADRYFQQDIKDILKLVPEGVEGQVPYKGSAANVLHQLAGGLRAAMGYVGARTIGELHAKARFLRISGAGRRERHGHGVASSREGPTYQAPGCPLRSGGRWRLAKLGGAGSPPLQGEGAGSGIPPLRGGMTCA